MISLTSRFWILMAFVLFATLSCQRSSELSLVSAPKAIYHCAMHPRIVSEKRGECPICHMRLTLVNVAPEPVGTSVAVQGLVSVVLSPEVEERIGVRTAMVERRPFVTTIQAPAFVAPLTNNDPNRSIIADVAEDQITSIHLDDHVDLTLLSSEGNVFKGIVRSLGSSVDSETRTVRVRIQTTFPTDLRPGTFVLAHFHQKLGTLLVIPEDALLDTGIDQRVYVEIKSGVFDPRPIRAGRDAERYIEVLDGLRVGERVVVSATFLVDSESKIEAAAQEAER